MKKFLKVFLLSTSLLSLQAIATEDNKPKNHDDKVVAEYQDHKVYMKDVANQFKEFLASQPTLKGKKFSELDKQIQENMVKGYVHSQLIELEVQKSDIQESETYKKKLEELKVQVAQQVYLENIVKEKVKESSLKAEYDKLKKEFSGKEEAKASHILVQEESLAKEIKEKLDKGAKFAELAKEYSKDEGSKSQGGELGYMSQGQLVPEFESKLFSMKKGEISDPVKTQFGWHIIKLEDTRHVKVPSYDEVKPSLEAKLSREVIEGYISELSKKYNVKIEI
jgi:parvulin-like peptidyl-prolyl isomerase